MAISNRVRRNIAFGLGSAALTLLLYAVQEAPNVVFKMSMSTAYTAITLLMIALAIGPFNIIMNKRNPTSSYIRRDTGLWAGFFSILHVLIGLQVHLGGKFWLYFVYPETEKHQIPLRRDPFGLTNYMGLFSILIIIMLMIISNNAAVKKLGISRWKKYQQLVYVAAALTILHGALYQAIERRSVTFIGLLAAIALVAGGWQFAGYKKKARQNALGSKS